MRFKLLLSMVMLFALSGCVVDRVPVNWFKGNTHTHTVICGHADSEPEVVAKWYLDRGYHFLILSEHNHFIDPETVKLPDDRREDFLLIGGMEITGKQNVHSTAMNVNEIIDWKFNDPDKAKIVENHLHGTHEAGGELIVNHPNWKRTLSADDMSRAQGLRLFELYNGHPGTDNFGEKADVPTEVMWDEMLTEGKLIYGVSADDAHHFQTIAPDKSNPGKGWVMVQAASLDPDLITDAMARGDFYATSGIYLKACRRSREVYEVQVDAEKTEQGLSDDPQLRGRRIEDGDPGYRIDFIGDGGKVLKSVDGTEARFEIDDTTSYVRPKVTFVRSHPDGNAVEAYYAWGQPAFTDGRDLKAKSGVSRAADSNDDS